MLTRLAGCAALALQASVALAETPAPTAEETVAETAATDAVSAEAAFVEAERLTLAGKFTEACPLYEKSHALEPKLGVLLYLAECRERTGQLTRSLKHFRDAQALAHTLGDAREAIAQERADALLPRVNRLAFVFTARPADVSVTLDGRLVDADTPAFVDAGRHSLRASAPGKRTWETVVELNGEGQQQTVVIPELAFVPSPAVVQVAAMPPPASDAVDFHASDHELAEPPRAAWWLTGASAVSLATAGVMASVAWNQYANANCSDRDICDAQGTRERHAASELLGYSLLPATIGLITGGLALWQFVRVDSDAASPPTSTGLHGMLFRF